MLFFILTSCFHNSELNNYLDNDQNHLNNYILESNSSHPDLLSSICLEGLYHNLKETNCDISIREIPNAIELVPINCSTKYYNSLIYDTYIIVDSSVTLATNWGICRDGVFNIYSIDLIIE